MLQQRKKEESERLRGERDQIKFIDLGFQRWQVVRFRKAMGRQDFPYVDILVLGHYCCNNFMWDAILRQNASRPFPVYSVKCF